MGSICMENPKSFGIKINMNSMDTTEDNHICIRCKQTINGLDNYVEHRKSGNCEPMSAHKYFNHLQLQCKYKSHSNDEDIDDEEEEDVDDNRSARSGTSDGNLSFNNTDEEVSEEEVDIYRPPNNFTGGKWKPGSHPQVSSTHRSNVPIISSYVTDSSSDGSEFYGHHKRRTSNQSIKSSAEESDQLFTDKSPNNYTASHSKSGKQLVGLSNQICSFYTNQSNTYFWHLTTSQHNSKVNSRNTHFECQICCETCDDVEKLMAHMESNQSIHVNSSGPLIVFKLYKIKKKCDNLVNGLNNRFVCDFCGIVFNFKSHLKRHTISQHIRRVAFPDLIKSNFIGDNPQYCCLKCDFKTDKQSTHLLHSMNHELPVPSTPITDTNTDFKTRNTFKKHHIRRTEDKYNCPVCNNAYICRELKQHINIHLNENPFECIVCEKKFSKLVYLRNHEKTHSSIKDKVCGTCGARFALNKLLKTHMKTHDSNRDRNVTCNVCGAQFYSKPILESHMKRHLPKADRPFKCEFPDCRYAFVNNSELLAHQRVHTSTDDKVLLCDQCGYKTKSVSALRKHYRQHTGDKPFECEFCDFKAYVSSNLNRHLRIHTGVKPYHCPYCRYFNHF
ncbi:unnamed protein product [Medioppia subpectinata]|uniref:C2H2-type domain-containing protein n=1 Tax=Medioppia subpectinata TaxID=1979941 RepID=A0A7R9KET2_9ACAR|nr:unnamed protein product [Medioppia subpectinata]CAG2101860.1 unnamed protein product [Medioppia subpectinata]